MELLAEREMLQALLDRNIYIRRRDTDQCPSGVTPQSGLTDLDNSETF